MLRIGSGSTALPSLPGPGLLFAVHDETIGTGLFLTRPARFGLRPVLQVTLAVVSRIGTGARLGLSAELGQLAWFVDGADRRVEWADRQLVITARPNRWPAVPAALRVPLARTRPDGPVLVPLWAAGLARLASAAVVAGDAPPARHRGVLLSSVHIAVRPARRPGARFAPIRNNGITAEPAARSGQPAMVKEVGLVARRPDPAYRSTSS